MWWIYFDSGAERASHRITHSSDPGRQARAAYTYVHLLVVAGIIVCAVADELVLVHTDHATPNAVAAILGGPALYLLGNAWFKWVTNDRKSPPLSHCAGLALLAVVGACVTWFHPSALSLGVLTTLILILVAVWETLALRRTARLATPS
jgi:low temperature requirement protein LtrA